MNELLCIVHLGDEMGLTEGNCKKDDGGGSHAI